MAPKKKQLRRKSSTPPVADEAKPAATGSDDDDWDDISREDTEPPIKAHHIDPMEASDWLKDSEASSCMDCGAHFTVFRRKHHCRYCGKIFCDPCSQFSPAYGGDRVCEACKAKDQELYEKEKQERDEKQRLEKERRMKLKMIKGLLKDTQEVETKERTILDDTRTKQIDKVLLIFQKDKGKLEAIEAEKKKEEEVAEKKEERGEVMDKWATKHGPRSGSLSLTVARCQGLVPPRLLLTASSAVLVKSDHVEFESKVVKTDVSPEFDFETYFAVEDDTVPILFFVRDYTVGYPMNIAQSRLDLRGDYKNLVRTVSSEGVYTEKGHAILDMWTKNHMLKDTFITVHWTFELREMKRVETCPACGRVARRCTCSEEDKQARAEAKQKALEAQLMAEMEEREKRHEAERLAAEEEAERRRAAAQKKFDADYADMDAEMDKKRMDTTMEERRIFEKVQRLFIEKYHETRLLEESRKDKQYQLELCLAKVASNEKAMQVSRFESWVSFAQKSLNAKEVEAKKAALAASAHERRTEDNKAKADADAEERQRQKEKREQKYQDDKAPLNQHMVESGRPRGEVHHDDEMKNSKKEKSSGCCVIS